MDHLSQKQYNQISKHISGTNNLSLEQIDKSIEQCKKQLEKLQSELDILERADHIGIQIRIINNIKAKNEQDLTESEIMIIKKFDILQLQIQNEQFCQQLQEKIAEIQSKITDLMKIRAVFIENYPEANTSPRLSRHELETSPRRHSQKLHSNTTNLSSSINTLLTASPKRTLQQTDRLSASDLMASPRRIKNK